jgi:hypothetical protein
VPHDILVAIGKKVWSFDRARIEKELQPQLLEAMAEVQSLNETLNRSFYLATEWLKERLFQDAPLCAAYQRLSEGHPEWP